MPLRFSYFTCTIIAAGLVAAVGGNIRAEEAKRDTQVRPASCDGGCTDAGCAGGCTDSAGCGSHGGLFGHGKHSWRHARCGHGGLLGHHGCGRNTFEGMDPHFNCGCNGSYNFPVPPLSTYMWPGMYKHQLMTAYDNPWRFPPIKAYTDEPADVLPEEFRRNYPEKARPPVIDLPEEDQASTRRSSAIQPVSLRRELPSRSYSGEETLSQKMERYYSSSSSR